MSLVGMLMNRALGGGLLFAGGLGGECIMSSSRLRACSGMSTLWDWRTRLRMSSIARRLVLALVVMQGARASRL